MPEITIEQWPHVVSKVDTEKNRYLFKWVTATIARKFTGRALGYTFQEDDSEGQKTIWNLMGQWNDQTKSHDPFDGRIYEAGEVVEVQLKMSEGDKRNFFDINNIRSAKGAPQSNGNGNGGSYADKELPSASNGQSGASNTVRRDERGESILKQVGFKAAVELLTAKMTSAKTAYDPFGEKEWQQLADDVWLSYNKLMRGQNPEQFEAFEEVEDKSPLVEAAKAMGATEQQAEQAVAQDTPQEVEELPW